MKFGWRPDEPDSRDKSFAEIEPKLSSIAVLSYASVTNYYTIPATTPISSQGRLGSCAANAACDAFELLRGDGVQLSRLFAYWNARRSHGDECLDEGTYNRSVFQSFSTLGVCLESTYPYVESEVNVRPTLAAYEDAYDHRITGYYRIAKAPTLLYDVETAVRANHPVVFGTQVGQAFVDYAGEDVIWHHPSRPIGGHSMVIDGVWNRFGRTDYRVRSSWSEQWGMGGYAWLSADYITDPWSDDFWVATED